MLDLKQMMGRKALKVFRVSLDLDLKELKALKV
jgi:hypothetical protein